MSPEPIGPSRFEGDVTAWPSPRKPASTPAIEPDVASSRMSDAPSWSKPVHHSKPAAKATALAPDHGAEDRQASGRNVDVRRGDDHDAVRLAGRRRDRLADARDEDRPARHRVDAEEVLELERRGALRRRVVRVELDLEVDREGERREDEDLRGYGPAPVLDVGGDLGDLRRRGERTARVVVDHEGDADGPEAEVVSERPGA